MLDPVTLIVVALATYRATRLIAVDKIMRRPRDWVDLRAPAWIGSLMSCPWCLSVWVAAPFTAAAYLAPVTHGPLTFLAIAGAAALLWSWEGND